ncbi:MAG: hypothetical protein WBV81_10530 [Ignavibacteriaceae bacterium]
MEKESIEKIAEDLRNIIIKTAVEKYEDASIAGLCAEGAWEAAIDAVRNIDLKEKLIEIKNNLSINN